MSSSCSQNPIRWFFKTCITCKRRPVIQKPQSLIQKSLSQTPKADSTSASHERPKWYSQKTFNTTKLKIPDPQRKNKLVGERENQKCYYLDVSLAHGVDLSRCGLFALELLRVFVGTTLLLEDNLPPLIRSPMWWHTLTPTICWNTSSSTQHSGASRQTTQSNQRGYWVALPRLEAGTRT